MILLKMELLALACAVAASSACSKSNAEPASGRADSTATSASGDDEGGDAQAAVDCTKIYTSGDAVGILNDPAKVSNDKLWPGSCTFDTAKEGGSIAVRAGSTIEMSWIDVTQSRDSLKYSPLSGVGERAVRKADGTEILAKKGKSYCAVELTGMGQSGSGTDSDFTKTRDEELAKKLGQLCSKYFAAN
jgi:hypothetical protein